jgi:hypothetical protein
MLLSCIRFRHYAESSLSPLLFSCSAAIQGAIISLTVWIAAVRLTDGYFYLTHCRLVDAQRLVRTYVFSGRVGLVVALLDSHQITGDSHQEGMTPQLVGRFVDGDGILIPEVRNVSGGVTRGT